MSKKAKETLSTKAALLWGSQKRKKLLQITADQPGTLRLRGVR